MAVKGASGVIKNSVLNWEGVTVSPHRFGGIEFKLGKRELGHIHGDSLVDIPFPTGIRNELVKAGKADAHHILPDSGWTSLYLREKKDIDRAIELLKLSYESALKKFGEKKK